MNAREKRAQPGKKRITSFRPTSQREIALQEGTRGRKIWDLEKLQGVSSSGCSGLPWPWRTGTSPWRLGEGSGRPGTAGVGGGGSEGAGSRPTTSMAPRAMSSKLELPWRPWRLLRGEEEGGQGRREEEGEGTGRGGVGRPA